MRSTTRRTALLLPLVTGLGLACLPKKKPTLDAAQGWADGSKGPPEVGAPLADFRLPDLQGRQVSLSEQRGKVVIVNFWATWCVPCRAEMPEIVRAYERYESSGLTVLAINLQEDPPEVESFVRQYATSFPVLLDRDGQVARVYHLRGVPATYIVDREGKTAAIQLGPMTAELIEQKLKGLL